MPGDTNTPQTGTGSDLVNNNNNSTVPSNQPGVEGDCQEGYTRSSFTGDCVKIVTPTTEPDPGLPPEDDPGDGGDVDTTPAIIGCMDPAALNYDPKATKTCGNYTYLLDENGELISAGVNDNGDEIFEVQYEGGSSNTCCVYPGEEEEPIPGNSEPDVLVLGTSDAKPSDCPDLSAPTVQEQFNQTCFNNLDAYVPNWLDMNEGEVFLNQRTCEYSIVMFADPPECSQEYFESFIPDAVDRLIRYYNKEETTDFVTITKSSRDALIEGGLFREGLAFRTDAVRVKTFYISPRRLEKTRILITVRAEEFNRIPDKEEEYSETAETQFGVEPSYVVFYTSEILNIFNLVSRNFRSFETSYADWSLKNGKVIRGLNFTADSNRLQDFYRDLSLLLGESGLSYRELETLEIGFDPNYKIEYIKTKKRYRPAVLIQKGLQNFIESTKNKNTSLMAYISRLPDIREDMVARKPLSWYEILEKYRFPPMQEDYVNDLTSPLIDGNEGLKALANASCPTAFEAFRPKKNAGEWALTQVNSIKDALMFQLREEPCLLIDGKILEQRNRENLASQVIDLTLKEYLASDRIISDLPELIANGRWDSIEELYTGLLDNLGYCGIISLIKSAIDCLLSALGYGDSIKIILAAAIRGMNPDSFAKFLNSVPTPLQEVIVAATNERLPQLLPFLQSIVSVRIVDDEGIEIESVVDRTLAYSYTSAGKWTRIDASSSSTKGTIFHNRMANPNYPPPSAEDYRSLGEVVTDLIMDDLLNVDDILAVIETLPGAPIAISVIEKLDKFCAAPPRFYPPLSEVLQIPGINIDICRLQDGITIPTVPRLQMPKLTIAGISDILIENGLVALKEIARRLLVLVLKKIIQIIFEEICKQRVGSDPTNLRSLIQAGCANGLDESTVDQALGDIAGILGCAAEPEAVARFVDNVSSVITECELVDLINGDASDSIYELVHQIILLDELTEPLAECLNDKHSISDFFKALGLFIDTSMICSISPLDLPFSQEVCDDLGLLQLFRDTRAQALRDKGVDEECIREQLCLLRDKTAEDLKELTDMLNSGIFNNILPDFVQDPRTPDRPGILPSVTPADSISLSAAFDSMYETLTVSYTTDLIGRRGFLNMCLADSRGRGFAQHKSLERSILGPSVFNIYGSRGTRSFPARDEWGRGANNPAQHNSWIKGPIEYSGKTFSSLPFLFNPLSAIADDTGNFSLTTMDEDENNTLISVEGRPPAVGGLPDKVAGYLQDQLRQFNPGFNKEFPFSTTIRWEEYERDISEFTITVNYNYHLPSQPYDRDVYSLNLITEITPPGLIPATDSSISLTTEDPIPEDILDFINVLIADRPGIENPSDVWAAFIENRVRNASIDPDLVPGEIYDTFNNQVFNSVNAGLLRNLGQDISKVDIFDYGYDKQSIPQIIYFHEDPGGEYEGNIAAAIQRYGGSEANPPFYIKQPEESGFLKVANSIAPEVSLCQEEGDVATRFPNFFELKDAASSLIGKFKDDERLSYCRGDMINVEEAPFDRALPAASVALNDSLIYATIRIYVSEVFLKALPTFYFLKPRYPNNYSNILPEYVISIMDEGLKSSGRGDTFKRTWADYRYLFYEQVVQTFIQKVDYGIITDASEAELEALTAIRDFVSNNWEGYKLLKNNPIGTRIEKKRRWRAVFENEDKQDNARVIENCKVILRRYVGEEISRMISIFAEVIPQNENYPIESIDDILINSPNRVPVQIPGTPIWNDVPYIAGAINEDSDGGPLDVPTLEYYAIFNAGSQNMLPHPFDTSTPPLDERVWPFVLERYVTYDGTDIQHPYGKVINIFDWEDITPGYSLNNVKFGLRLSYVPTSNDRDFMNLGDMEANIDSSVAFSDKAYTTEFKNLIPIVSVEERLSSTGIYSASLYGDYLQQLVCKLIETPEYRMTFRYAFPMPKYSSLLAIYTSNAFVPSLAQLKDGWAATVLNKEGGGQWIGFGEFGGMRTWRGNEGVKNSFKKAKRVARQLLEASCNTNYAYKDRDLLTPTEAYVDLQKAKDDKGFGIKWWQWSSLRPPPCKKED